MLGELTCYFRHPLNAYSITIGKPTGKGNENHVPPVWVGGMGEFMRKFFACGVVSYERGDKAWGLHLQIIGCAHAPTDALRLRIQHAAAPRCFAQPT